MPASTPYRLAHWGPAFGMVTGIGYVVCLLWGFLLTNPVLQEWHMAFFRIMFLDAGFVGLNLLTFILGFVGAYIGGLVTGWVLALCLNHCQRWFP